MVTEQLFENTFSCSPEFISESDNIADISAHQALAGACTLSKVSTIFRELQT